MIRSSRWAWGWSVFVWAAAAACGSTSSGPGGNGGGNDAGSGLLAQQTVGASGGMVATSDGVLTIQIPAGALGANTTITVQGIASPAPGSIGTTYDIGPSGTQFASPVTLSFRYAGVNLQGYAPTSLEVATFANGAWVPLTGDTVDTAAQSASGTTTHLSPYAVIAGPSADDAGASAGGAPDGGASPDASGPPCSADGSPSGSCQSPGMPLCSYFPGTYVASCTNNAGGGYTAMCCPGDAGAPTPDAGGLTDAAGAPDVGGPACSADGSPSGSCQSPGMPLCSYFPGTYVASCTNNAGGGYTAKCCPGAPSDGGTPPPDTGAPTDAASAPDVGGPACSTDGSNIGSCVNSPQPPCSHFPGTYVASCTDGTAGGYVARCCPITDAATD
jgi:hypothetical protein